MACTGIPMIIILYCTQTAAGTYVYEIIMVGGEREGKRLTNQPTARRLAVRLL